MEVIKVSYEGEKAMSEKTWLSINEHLQNMLQSILYTGIVIQLEGFHIDGKLKDDNYEF